MRINGLELPVGLLELIQSGLWNAETCMNGLVAHYNQRRGDDYQFHSVADIKAETSNWREFVADYPSEGLLYMMASSSQQEHVIAPPLLDIDMAMVIISDYSEPLVWLDYRKNSEPSVLILRPHAEVGFGWYPAASTFGEFQRKLLSGERSSVAGW